MRLISILLILCALGLLAMAFAPMINGGAYDALSLGGALAMIDPKITIGIGKWLELRELFTLYDYVVLPVLSAPLWLMSGALGVLLFAVAWGREATR